jgi:hypothetical protein
LFNNFVYKGYSVVVAVGVHATAGGGGSKQQSVSTSRDSSTSYEYSITFDYEFSTSSDLFTAGHASDIIVGGVAVLPCWKEQRVQDMKFILYKKYSMKFCSLF